MFTCPTCHAKSSIVNQCGCDPNNLPTPCPYRLGYAVLVIDPIEGPHSVYAFADRESAIAKFNELVESDLAECDIPVDDQRSIIYQLHAESFEPEWNGVPDRAVILKTSNVQLYI